MESVFDIIVIGGGVAGLSAASTIVRQDHTVLILDSQAYRNEKTKHMHALPTWDHRDPNEWRTAAKEDLDRYGCVRVEHEDVVKVEQLDSKLFKLTCASSQQWLAKKLILASGVEDVLPNIPGYAECWASAM